MNDNGTFEGRCDNCSNCPSGSLVRVEADDDPPLRSPGIELQPGMRVCTDCGAPALR